MPYSGANDTALQGDGVLLFHALEIVLPGPVNIRLLDGSGFVTIGGNLYAGDDATYGALDGIDPFTDGVGGESPHLVFRVDPPSNAAAAALASASNQGSAVSLYFGEMDRATGLLIGAIDTLFIGEIDVGILTAGKNSRQVEVDVASQWDRFFDLDEGIVLNNAWYQSLYPGKLGLEYITDIQLQIPWGTDGVRPNVVTDVPASSRQNTVAGAPGWFVGLAKL